MSRLRLDFDLVSDKERADFIRNYLNQTSETELQEYINKYRDRPFPFPGVPTNAEKEMIGNYILWGKSEDNPVGNGYIEIENKGKWNKRKAESLDTIMEHSQETGAPVEVRFGAHRELGGKAEHEVRQTKVRKANLNRDEVRRALDDGRPRSAMIRQTYEELWSEIDYLDYVVTLYQLKKGIRQKEIRQELVDRMPLSRKQQAERFVREIDTHRYGKLRRLLIDKRQEQYALKDCFAPAMYPSGISHAGYFSDSSPDMLYLPLGLKFRQNDKSRKVFRRSVDDDLIGEVIPMPSGDAERLDFRESGDIGLMVYAIEDLKWRLQEIEFAEERELLQALIDTYDFYVEWANLKGAPKRVLEYKEAGLSNAEIAQKVNAEFGTGYAQNYISTIFTQQVCAAIAKAATLHCDTIKALSKGFNAYKKCRVCEKRLLLDDRNYNRQRSQPDGYAAKCKACNKASRR